ncbi:FkbM family methyltransferase [Salinarimonas sp.]|uniref:FkbM family methyltransferase n=1 Tax=Salinarimonas sp. TaxID=2766526 RepID=UPI0032D9606C
MRTLQDFVAYMKARGFQPGTVVDVGACYGTPELFRTFPDAYHIYFEPVRAREDRLRLLTTKYPGEYHLMALADRPGMALLLVPEQRPETSMFIEPSRVETLSEDERRQLVEVPVSTLDDVLDHRDLRGPILLKTDCQGYDREVLRGGRRLLRRVDLVVAETLLYRFDSNTPTTIFSEIVGEMAQQGFEVFDIVSYNLRHSDDALLYVDLVFARRDASVWSPQGWT